MSVVLLIISVALAIFGFLRIRSTKWKCTILGLALLLAVLSFFANTETAEQLQLAIDQAFEASEQADRAQAQITEIKTPRRMELETMRMLAEKLKPYAGQKYDMKVFRDQDSLKLASTIQAILDDEGWVYTNVYPKHSTDYAETRDMGVFVISGKAETTRTSEARTALRGALTEAGLYNDSNAFIPVNCAESTALPQVGDKITPIPCSDSPIKSIEIEFTVDDDVIPGDTLVLHVGKERL